jgi:hypothetical protein
MAREKRGASGESSVSRFTLREFSLKYTRPRVGHPARSGDLVVENLLCGSVQSAVIKQSKKLNYHDCRVQRFAVEQRK